MPIVNPNLPANLFIQPISQSALPSDLRQLNLRMDQVIRAIVVDGGMDRVFLEMNNQQFRAESERELQVGQQLRLQVTQLVPRPEFRVLQDIPKDRLAQMLPQLARSYDWTELVVRLQQGDLQPGVGPKFEPVIVQVGQLLGFSEKEGAQDLLKQVQRVLELINRMPQHGGSEAFFARRSLAPSVAGFHSLDLSEPIVGTADRIVKDIVQKLQLQLVTLKNVTDSQTVQPDWLDKTRTLLQPLQKGGLLASTTPLSPASGLLLKDVVSQLLIQPKVTPQLAIELERILVNLKDSLERPLAATEKAEGIVAQKAEGSVAQKVEGSVAQKVEGSVAQKVEGIVTQKVEGIVTQKVEGSVTQKAEGSVTQKAEGSVTQKAEGIVAQKAEGSVTQKAEGIVTQNRAEAFSELLRLFSKPPGGLSSQSGDLKPELQRLVQLVRESKAGLSPDLMGRLEGLLSRLQQLAPVGQETLLTQLMQVSSQSQQVPQRLHLGLLSQLFGFYLEAELLQGKEKAALATLKAGLLNFQLELGEEVAEPLRRLELFQLCKARLAEDQIQFLPLPFSELEEGYLLADKASESDGQGSRGINLSLSLRLSSLGNLRIDMLYRPGQGLQMQVAGESQEKKRFLESSADEMRDAVKRLDVHKIHFSADAKPPTKMLQERLMPDMGGVLDERL